jgi:NAD(P)-dependent dehydrogenase (short-subunit alcohol dehydrogenase family)/predicted RNA methylase
MPPTPTARTRESRTHEQTINTALAEILESLGRTWTIRSEDIGGIFEEGGRPDILIEKSDGWPIVIEAEVANHRQAEIEARSRISKTISASSHKVHAAVALVYADDLRRHRGEGLREAIRAARFEYVLFSTDREQREVRFPAAGWIEGGIKELAILLHRSSIPAWRVEALADVLESGVTRAAGTFSRSHPTGSSLGRDVAELLGQLDDDAGQTRRMAMTVIADALVFHAALAEAEMMIHDQQSGRDRAVREPRTFRRQGAFRPSAIIDEWERILEVNYWPIFHTASSILRIIPTQLAATILGLLWDTAEQLVVGGVTRSHDLTGVVFQRLIADRKFLATYYTMPSGAALLAGLAVPLDAPLMEGEWSDPAAVSRMRIGDFACGTGTLLSTAYQRIGLLHELNGGNPKELHRVMMRQDLVGLDVLTVAVHLTAAMLAGTHPDTPFDGECLLTMPYGSHSWGVCVGSLDLLDAQTSFDIIQAAAHSAGGRGEEEVRDLMARVRHGQFDLVIMNPPFTRHGAREGDRTQVHNPAFAASGADEEEQDRLANRLSRLASGGVAHGHAGMASYFADLADRKLAPGGTLALVLPLTAMSGSSWEKVRTLWRTNYSALMVVTIAEAGSHSRSFSADTGMAECLVVGRMSVVR